MSLYLTNKKKLVKLIKVMKISDNEMKTYFTLLITIQQFMKHSTKHQNILSTT